MLARLRSVCNLAQTSVYLPQTAVRNVIYGITLCTRRNEISFFSLWSFLQNSYSQTRHFDGENINLKGRVAVFNSIRDSVDILTDTCCCFSTNLCLLLTVVLHVRVILLLLVVFPVNVYLPATFPMLVC